MQRNSIIKYVVLPIVVLTLSVAGWYTIAQSITTDDGGDRKVKITITTTENGKTHETVKEVTLKEGEHAEDVLKEMGIFDDLKMKDGKGFMDIRIRSQDEDDWSEDHDFQFCFPKGMGRWIGCHDSLAASRAYLGAMLQGESGKEGVELSHIIEGSPADKAGLKDGDILLSIDKGPVNTPAEVMEMIGSKKPETSVQLQLKRNGELLEKTVQLGKAENSFNFSFPHLEAMGKHLESVDWDAFEKNMEEKINTMDWDSFGHQMEAFFNGKDWEEFGHMLEKNMQGLGTTLEYHLDEDLPFLGVSGSPFPEDGQKGLRIQHVSEGSPADNMGLKTGDVITKVNGTTIQDIGDLLELFKPMKAGDKVNITYNRDGKQKSAQGSLAKRESLKKRMGNMRWNFDSDEMKEHHQNQGTRITIRIEDVSKADEDKLEGVLDLGEKSELKLESVALNPNPANGRFELRFALAKSGTTTVRVFDANGRRVYDETLNNFKGDYSQVIDISGEPNGFYFLSIEQNGKAFTKKIVKQ
ncbi:MAG: PDZ domain-containing protein [Flavobacteriales bacterium]|nr:PDZ domain-containing protein [Flavobacteriales bacterium]